MNIYDPISDIVTDHNGKVSARFQASALTGWKQKFFSSILGHQPISHDPQQQTLYDAQKTGLLPIYALSKKDASLLIDDFCERHELEKPKKISYMLSRWLLYPAGILLFKLLANGINLSLTLLAQNQMPSITQSVIIFNAAMSVIVMKMALLPAITIEGGYYFGLNKFLFRSEPKLLNLFHKNDKYRPKIGIPLDTLIHELCHMYIDQKSAGSDRPQSHGPLFAHILVSELEHYDPSPDRNWSADKVKSFREKRLMVGDFLNSKDIQLSPSTPQYAKNILQIKLSR